MAPPTEPPTFMLPKSFRTSKVENCFARPFNRPVTSEDGLAAGPAAGDWVSCKAMQKLRLAMFCNSSLSDWQGMWHVPVCCWCIILWKLFIAMLYMWKLFIAMLYMWKLFIAMLYMWKVFNHEFFVCSLFMHVFSLDCEVNIYWLQSQDPTNWFGMLNSIFHFSISTFSQGQHLFSTVFAMSYVTHDDVKCLSPCFPNS